MSDARSTAADPADDGFRRSLGLFDSTMVVVGAMIGSGIFLVSADMARLLGSSGWLLTAWLLTGAMTVVLVPIYATLGLTSLFAALLPFVSALLLVGTGVKFVREDLGSQVGGPTTTALLFDVGSIYYLGLGSVRIATSLTNFGSTLRVSGYWSTTRTDQNNANGFAAEQFPWTPVASSRQVRRRGRWICEVPWQTSHDGTRPPS